MKFWLFSKGFSPSCALKDPPKLGIWSGKDFLLSITTLDLKTFIKTAYRREQNTQRNLEI